MATSTVFVTILLYFINKTIDQNLRLNCFNSFSETLLSVFSVLINHPFLKVPKQATIRLILICWFLCSLNFSSIYSSKIVSFLTDSTYEVKLTTFEDLLNSGLHFGLTRQSGQFFNRELNDYDSLNIFNKSRKCRTIIKCLNRTATSRDCATAISRSYFNFIKHRFRDEEGNYLIIPMKINIVSTSMEFLFKKNFQIKHRINEIMRNICESGLIDYWQRNLNRNTLTDEMKIVKLNSNLTKHLTINLTILKDIFIFLFYGWFLSVVLLIGELIYFWVNCKYFVKIGRDVRASKGRLKKRKNFVGRNIYKRQKFVGMEFNLTKRTLKKGERVNKADLNQFS